MSIKSLQFTIFEVTFKSCFLMKKPLLLLSFVALITSNVKAQSIEDLMNQVSIANLQTSVAQLSGEQSATINGSSQTITSRVHSNNDLAADYIKER